MGKPRYYNSKKRKQFFKFCNRCDKKFQPTGRTNFVCPKCKKTCWKAFTDKYKKGEITHDNQIKRIERALKNGKVKIKI